MKALSTGPRFAAIAGVLALLTVLSACTSGSTESGGENKGGPRVRLAVGIDASYAPFFLADREGLFKKAGLNVEIVQFGRGGQGVDALATGQVQMAGNSDTTTIGQLQQNPDLRALLVYEESGRYLKVVGGKNVKDAAQIKKMAIVPGLSELAAIRFLESKKIDPKKIKFVPAEPPEIPALLQKGDADAYVLWEPWPVKGVGLGGHIMTTTGAYGLAYQHWLVAGKKWLAANEATAGKIAKVLDQAARRVEADPRAAADATGKSAKIPEDQTITAVREIDFKVRDINPADVRTYQATADFFVDTGKVKARPDVRLLVLQGWFGTHAG